MIRNLPLLLAICFTDVASATTLQFNVIDGETGNPTAARFSLKLNDIPWYPDRVRRNGLRFVSHHVSKN